MNIKVYGLKRSGTNYLEYLLEQNGFNVLFDSPETPWKHGPPINFTDKHICIIKDPYAWRVSERCHSEGDTEKVQNIKDWNKIVSQYLQKAAEFPDKFFIIKYKDLLDNNLGALSKFLNTPISQINISTSMGYERDVSPFKFDAKFYEGEYLNYLTKGDLLELKKIQHPEFIEIPLPENHVPAISLTARATGHGDAVMAAQLAYSLEQHLGRKVILYTVRHRTAKNWIGYSARPVYKEEPDSIHINGWFSGHKSHLGEVTIGKKRIDFYKEQLPPNFGDFPILIPPLINSLPPTSKTQICIFPYSTDVTRTYPENKWLDIYKRLKRDGYEVAVALPKEVHYKVWDDCNTIHLNSIEEVISLINNSDLVLGNDSGPIHFAGILRKKGLALLGIYSPETLFGGYETVEGITNESTPCFHCFNLKQKGFSEACRQKCSVLNSIDPRDVVDKVRELI